MHRRSLILLGLLLPAGLVLGFLLLQHSRNANSTASSSKSALESNRGAEQGSPAVATTGAERILRQLIADFAADVVTKSRGNQELFRLYQLQGKTGELNL